VKLKLEKGIIKEVLGGREADIYRKWLASFNHPNMYNLAHYQYGFNPGARLSYQVGESERVYGCHDFGIGSSVFGAPAPAHSDGVVQRPTIWLDEELIEKDGEFVHPELAEIEKELRSSKD